MFPRLFFVATIAVGSILLSAACGDDRDEKSEAVVVRGDRGCPTATDARPLLEGPGALLGERSTLVRVIGLYATKRVHAPSTLCWYRVTGSGEACGGDPTRESVVQSANGATGTGWFYQDLRRVDDVRACDDVGKLRGYRVVAPACPDVAPEAEDVRTSLGLSTLVGGDSILARTACFYRTLREPCEPTFLGNNAGYCMDDLRPEDVPTE